MKIVVLGSHKGLGFQCVKALLQSAKVTSVLGLSRQDSGVYEDHPKYRFISCDFTKIYDSNNDFESLLKELKDFEPDVFIYVAGGGPHGVFSSKAWKDHEWSIKLNFLFPAKLVWALMSSALTKKVQFIYVGSAIAESEEGDVLGPSYAAGKCAMKGLFNSVQHDHANFNFQWISPGYMDTELLPPKATPRVLGQEILAPEIVAQQILELIRA